MNKKILFFVFGLLILGSLSFVSSQGEITGTAEATVCCEKTNSGLFCQDVAASDCAPGSKQPPTACSETQDCKPGWC